MVMCENPSGFVKYSDLSVWHQQLRHVQSHLITFRPHSEAQFEFQ